MNANKLSALFRSPFGRIIALTLLVFTLVPLIALTGLSAYSIRKQLEEHALSQMTVVSKVIQQSVTEWINTGNAQLADLLKDTQIAQRAEHLLQNQSTASDAETGLTEALSSLTQNANFDKIMLVDPGGTVAYATDTALKGVTLSVNFAQRQKDSKPFVGFGKLYESGEQSAITWQPVVERSGDTLGYLVGRYDVKALKEVLYKNSDGIGQTGEVYLVDIDELPITELRSPQSPIKFDVPIRAAIKKTRPDSTSPYTNYAKQPVFGAVYALQVPLTAWLVVEQQQSEAFEALYGMLRAAAILAFILIVLAIIAAILTTQNLLTPLQTLQQAANAMALGELKTRVPVVREDEIGSLAFTFNTMATGLERAFADLETSNKKLRNRGNQLSTITRVGQHIVSFTDFNEVLNIVATEIQQTFGYYAVTLFLLDPEDETRLIASAAAGVAAQKYMESQPIREINEKSLVGTAAFTRKVINVKSVHNDQRFLSNPLRPDTKSEISIPLLIESGKLLVGVLDIQSNELATFTTDDIEVLQILGDQIAIGIRNAELFRQYEVARQMADEANRQKSEFLSNMSHELRTPLNVIIGYSHSILNRPAMYNHVPLPSVYEDGIASIMNSGQHLLGLINDILDLSKIEAGQIDLNITPIDPLPILQGVRSTALGLIKKNVQLRVDYPDELPWIMGDELRVRQMLLNLISNAAKFTEQGFIRLDAKMKDDKVLFIIEDTGAGIPEEAQQFIFQRYRQASKDVVRKHGGTGLGLSICLQLANLQGGEIWFDSTVGKGSTFYFTIPIAPDSITEEEKTTIRAESSGEISSRVSVFAMKEEEPELARQLLVLDTHAATRYDFELKLSGDGYEILVAESVERAITIATAFLPELLIVHKHEVDSEHVLEFIRQVKEGSSPTPETPILILDEVNTKAQGWEQAVLDQIKESLSDVTTHIGE